MKHSVSFFLLIFSCLTLGARNVAVTGRITESGSGKGIAGVRVSDGYGWTTTDSRGCYKISPDSRARVVYYSLPAAYAPALAEDTQLPLFYAPIERGRKCVRNFSLKPAPVEQDFDLVMVGDPQAKNERQVARFRAETIPDIESTVRQPAYIVGLGDLVSDSDPSWDLMRSAISGVKAVDGSVLPFYNAIGNHDHMNYDKTPWDAQERWIRDYGPVDFSFDRGAAHIVVMEDCFNLKPRRNNSVNGVTWGHEGGFSDEQYRWLAEDIAAVPDKEHKLLVFCCHIPFGAGLGKSEVLKTRYHDECLRLFAQFGEAHIMSAHRHMTINIIHKDYICRSGLPVYEHVHCASCGYFWFRNCNSDGTPSGYSIYSVSGPHISNWYIKPTGRPADYQMRVYDGSRLEWDGPLKDAFIVELWNGDDTNWKLELYAGGEKVGDFIRCEAPVVNCEAVDAAVKAIGKRKWPSLSVWSKPILNKIWYFRPSSMSVKQMDWEVRATQSIPGDSRKNVYVCRNFISDDSWF